MAGDWERLRGTTSRTSDETDAAAPGSLQVAAEREPSSVRRRLAAGSEMLQPAASERYRVIVRYREPSYERRHGARPAPCEWACALEARTNAEAVEGALEQFRLLERVSSATWSRHIIDAVAMREGIDDVDDVGE